MATTDAGLERFLVEWYGPRAPTCSIDETADRINDGATSTRRTGRPGSVADGTGGPSPMTMPSACSQPNPRKRSRRYAPTPVLLRNESALPLAGRAPSIVDRQPGDLQNDVTA